MIIEKQPSLSIRNWETQSLHMAKPLRYLLSVVLQLMVFFSNLLPDSSYALLIIWTTGPSHLTIVKEAVVEFDRDRFGKGITVSASV